MNGFVLPGFGFSVKTLWRARAHSAGGAARPGKQGAGVGEGFAASPAIMLSCAVVGRKIFVLINRGTAVCAFCSKPSNATKRNVLSFLIGKPRVPPNCWRVKVSFTGVPKEGGLAGLKVSPGCNAWVNENGFWASKASSRKNP